MKRSETWTDRFLRQHKIKKEFLFCCVINSLSISLSFSLSFFVYIHLRRRKKLLQIILSVSINIKIFYHQTQLKIIFLTRFEEGTVSIEDEEDNEEAADENGIIKNTKSNKKKDIVS